MQHIEILYGRVAQWQSMGLQILRSPVRLRSRPLFFMNSMHLFTIVNKLQIQVLITCDGVRGLVVTIPASGAGGRGFDSRRTPVFFRWKTDACVFYKHNNITKSVVYGPVV